MPRLTIIIPPAAAAWLLLASLCATLGMARYAATCDERGQARLRLRWD